MRFRRSYPPVPTTPRLARSDAEEALGPLLSGVAMEDVRLMLSEAVTYSVEHGAERDIELRISADHRAVRIEVASWGPALGRSAPPSRDGPSGWGLYVLDHLAERWSVVAGEPNVVWFEVRRPSGRAAAEATG